MDADLIRRRGLCQILVSFTLQVKSENPIRFMCGLYPSALICAICGLTAEFRSNEVPLLVQSGNEAGVSGEHTTVAHEALRQPGQDHSNKRWAFKLDKTKANHTQAAPPPLAGSIQSRGLL